MKRRAWLLIATCAVSGCSTAAQRAGRNFVRWDAMSDAASSAETKCGGNAELIAGRTGYDPSDYRCVAASAQPR